MTVIADKENIAPIAVKQRARLYGGTPQSADRLFRPFNESAETVPDCTADLALGGDDGAASTTRQTKTGTDFQTNCDA